MKVCIDEGQCRIQELTFNEALMLLIIKTGGDIPKIISDLLKKEAIVETADLFDKHYMLTQGWDDRLMAAILNAEYDDPDSMEERLDNLAKALMELFPKGKKEGTPYYWRGNIKDTKLKLKKFLKLYGNRSDEEIIDAARRYVESFNGNYKFMRILKYFIWKDDRKMNEDGTIKIESISELASYLENKGQENVNNNNWTATLI